MEAGERHGRVSETIAWGPTATKDLGCVEHRFIFKNSHYQGKARININNSQKTKTTNSTEANL